jgi:hypothetical protein
MKLELTQQEISKLVPDYKESIKYVERTKKLEAVLQDVLSKLDSAPWEQIAQKGGALAFVNKVEAEMFIDLIFKVRQTMENIK